MFTSGTHLTYLFRKRSKPKEGWREFVVFILLISKEIRESLKDSKFCCVNDIILHNRCLLSLLVSKREEVLAALSVDYSDSC
jgi:hypothetical protein